MKSCSVDRLGSQRTAVLACSFVFLFTTQGNAQVSLEKELKQSYLGRIVSVSGGYKDADIIFNFQGQPLRPAIQSCKPTEFKIRNVKINDSELRLSGERTTTPSEREQRRASRSQVFRIASNGKPWIRRELLTAIDTILNVKPSEKLQLVRPENAKNSPGDPAILYVLPEGPVYNGRRISARLKAIETPDPEYTESARKLRAEGETQLQLVVLEDGTVAHVRRVSEPLGFGLDESAVAAVSKWRFEPALRDGIPVKVEITVSMRFCLY
ncbi:MAG: energy transducer TonB [Candidatus Korobacteraceae bacterium]